MILAAEGIRLNLTSRVKIKLPDQIFLSNIIIPKEIRKIKKAAGSRSRGQQKMTRRGEGIEAFLEWVCWIYGEKPYSAIPFRKARTF